MARVNLEERSFSDPRIDEIADLMEWPTPFALGVLSFIWHASQELLKPRATKRQIKLWTKLPKDMAEKFFRYLIEVELITELEADLFEIHGSEEQIETRLRALDRAKKGGEANRLRWAKIKQQRESQKPQPEPDIKTAPKNSKTALKSLDREKPKEPIPKKEKTPGGKVWAAYADEYAKTYNYPPLQDVQANTLCKKFAEKVPGDHAPKVARFFVRHRDKFYVQAMHPLTLLLRDASKLFTEYRNNAVMTSKMAFDADRAQHNAVVEGTLTITEGLNSS